MDGFVAACKGNQWSRLYFIAFYAFATVFIINGLVVAFILDSFLMRFGEAVDRAEREKEEEALLVGLARSPTGDVAAEMTGHDKAESEMTGRIRHERIEIRAKAAAFAASSASRSPSMVSSPSLNGELGDGTGHSGRHGAVFVQAKLRRTNSLVLREMFKDDVGAFNFVQLSDTPGCLHLMFTSLNLTGLKN